MKTVDIKLHFYGTHVGPGWLVLMSANNATLQWLENTIKEINPLEDAVLRVASQRNPGGPSTMLLRVLHKKYPGRC